MKKCFIVTSAIGIENNAPLLTSRPVRRTAFSQEERFRQTQYSINSINAVAPGSQIYLFDISKNHEMYKKDLAYKANVEYISCEELAPGVAEMCRTNPTKGLCEASSMIVFLKNYLDKVKQFDYMVKLSGRYFYVDFSLDYFNEQNRANYLFKQLRIFPWNDAWGYPKEMAVNNQMWWTPTQTYAVGHDLYDHFYAGLQQFPPFYFEGGDKVAFIDYEALMFHLIVKHRPFIQTSWICGGWGSSEGDYGEW